MGPGSVLQAFGMYAVQRMPLPALLLRPLGNLLVMLGRPMFLAGKKMSAPSADELMKRRKRRRPVLYLRSFELDPKSKTGALAHTEVPIPWNFGLHSQEEVLSKTLKRVGPCIAVGDPKRDDIVLGFARLRLGDDWQERVKALMEEAALVVLCTGGTPGVLWELEQAAKLVQPRSRLVLLVTPDVTEEWWDKADKLFGERVPRFDIYSEYIPYVGVIYFDGGRTQQEAMLFFDRTPRATLEEALDPLLRQLNVRPRPKLIRWISHPRRWPVLLLVCWFLFIIMLGFITD